MKKDEKEKLISQAAIKDSIYSSLKETKEKYSKSPEYNRKLYEDKIKMDNFKKNVFNNQEIVKDPYTGKVLASTQKEALQKYEKTGVSAETDHRSSIKETHEKYKSHPWVSTDDMKEAINSDKNFNVVSQEFNRTKGAKTNTEFEEYLNTKKKDFLSEEAK